MPMALRGERVADICRRWQRQYRRLKLLRKRRKPKRARSPA
jgi:hypothetical protein